MDKDIQIMLRTANEYREALVRLARQQLEHLSVELAAIRALREFLENMLDAEATRINVKIDSERRMLVIESDALPFRSPKSRISLMLYASPSTIARPEQYGTPTNEDTFSTFGNGARKILLALGTDALVISRFNGEAEILCGMDAGKIRLERTQLSDGVEVDLNFSSLDSVFPTINDFSAFLSQYSGVSIKMNGESVPGMKSFPLNSYFDGGRKRDIDADISAYLVPENSGYVSCLTFASRRQPQPVLDFPLGALKWEGESVPTEKLLVFEIKCDALKPLLSDEKQINWNSTNIVIQKIRTYVLNLQKKAQHKFVARRKDVEEKPLDIVATIKKICPPALLEVFKGLASSPNWVWNKKGDRKRRSTKNPDDEVTHGRSHDGDVVGPNHTEENDVGHGVVQKLKNEFPFDVRPQTGFNGISTYEIFNDSLVPVIKPYTDIGSEGTSPRAMEDILRRAIPETLSLRVSEIQRGSVRKMVSDLIMYPKEMNQEMLKERLKKALGMEE